MRTHANVARRTALTLLALAAACTAPVGVTPPVDRSTTSSPAPVGTSATSTPAPARYAQTVIVADAGWVDWLAAGDTQLFLAMNMRGARPSGTRSTVAAVPLSGGEPTPLPGTEAFGVEISGLTVFGNVVYFSRVGGPNLSDSGVFRYLSGQSVAVTTDPLIAPAGIVLNDAGDLFIAETNSGSVRRLSGGTITNYVGRGPCGDRNPPAAGVATEVAFCGPQLLALSATGDLYVAGRGPAWIAKVDPAGALSVFVKDFGPSSLAIDTDGALLASGAVDGRLVRFDAAGTPTVLADDLRGISAISVGRDGSIYVRHSIATSGAALSRVTRLRRV